MPLPPQILVCVCLAVHSTILHTHKSNKTFD